jgi:DNA-binding response OmpR family regulator
MNQDKKSKILVVDDEPNIAELLEIDLDSAGYEVIIAYNGKEALERVKEIRPDLILLDVMMPELNGFQTCEILRKDEDNISIPIIMLTAQDDESEISKALELGADDYAIKPVKKNELFKKIEKLLFKTKTGKLPSQYYRE